MKLAIQQIIQGSVQEHVKAHDWHDHVQGEWQDFGLGNARGSRSYHHLPIAGAKCEDSWHAGFNDGLDRQPGRDRHGHDNHSYWVGYLAGASCPLDHF